MNQAKPSIEGNDPIVISINPWRLIVVAILAAIFGLSLIGKAVLLGVIGGSFAMPIWSVILLGLLFCVWSISNIGLAVSRPSAHRIDAFGVSGYYVPALEWSEISSVTLDMKAHRLFIAVRDMHAVRMRQINVWRRLRLMRNAVGVPTSGLKCDLDQIASIMNAHLSRNELDKSPPL